MKGKHVSTDTLVAAYLAGDSMQKIGDAHGMSREGVRLRLKKAGVTSRPSATSASEYLPMDVIADEYAQGATGKELAAAYSVSADTILRYLHRRGVVVCKIPVNRRDDVRAEAVVTEYVRGASTYYLAAKYKASPTTVAKAVRAAGVIRPKYPMRREIPDDFVAEYARGISRADIARRENVDRRTVDNWVRYLRLAEHSASVVRRLSQKKRNAKGRVL